MGIFGWVAKKVEGKNPTMALGLDADPRMLKATRAIAAREGSKHEDGKERVGS